MLTPLLDGSAGAADGVLTPLLEGSGGIALGVLTPLSEITSRGMAGSDRSGGRSGSGAGSSSVGTASRPLSSTIWATGLGVSMVGIASRPPMRVGLDFLPGPVPLGVRSTPGSGTIPRPRGVFSPRNSSSVGARVAINATSSLLFPPPRITWGGRDSSSFMPPEPSLAVSRGLRSSTTPSSSGACRFLSILW